MKIVEIKELIQAMEESSLTCLELCEGGSKIRLEKATWQTVAPPISAAPATQQTVVAVNTASETAPEAHQGRAVTCPLVGVYYHAGSPEDAPFVAVGDHVKKGDVLCIIEAMKLMNEITAEYDGEITEICAANGDVVDYGQPLFYIR